jgi:heat shock protein HslJ
MACAGMEVERGLSAALDQADNYSVSGDDLSLNKARMAPVARFKAVK